MMLQTRATEDARAREIDCMANVMRERTASIGCCTDRDLAAAGFTERQIKDLADAARTKLRERKVLALM